MKNLLALVGLVVVVVAGAGWYLGWYQIGVKPGEIGVNFNTKKATEDVKKGVSEIIEHSGKNVEGTPTSRPLDPPPGGWSLPPLPSLPPTPNGTKIEFNADGTPKINITLPPPPAFPGNK